MEVEVVESVVEVVVEVDVDVVEEDRVVDVEDVDVVIVTVMNCAVSVPFPTSTRVVCIALEFAMVSFGVPVQ